MHQAVIFDMDGLLIDSEPVWRKVEIEVFARFGIRLREEQCLQTKGLRVDEVVRHWDRAFPGLIADLPAATECIVAGVEAELRRNAHPKPGALTIVEHALSRIGKVAIASSSPTRLIEAALQQLRLIDRIPIRCSAENEAFGKPHPGVYLTAAHKLGVSPATCLAFEDSLYGLMSAKAAGMTCIVVPEEEEDIQRFAMADRVLKSLTEMKSEYWETCTLSLVAK